MLLHLRQGSDVLRDSKTLESIEFAGAERPSGSLSVQMTGHLEELGVHDNDWFGKEETHHMAPDELDG